MISASQPVFLSRVTEDSVVVEQPKSRFFGFLTPAGTNNQTSEKKKSAAKEPITKLEIDKSRRRLVFADEDSPDDGAQVD